MKLTSIAVATLISASVIAFKDPTHRPVYSRIMVQPLRHAGAWESPRTVRLSWNESGNCWVDGKRISNESCQAWMSRVEKESQNTIDLARSPLRAIKE